MDWPGLFTDLLPVALPILGSAAIWGFSEHAKRCAERRHHKEERYTALLDSVAGFMVHMESGTALEERHQFLRQLELCWLSCPAAVVRTGYRFLDVYADVGTRGDERQEALGEFIMAIRRDLHSPARRWWSGPRHLQASEFRPLRTLPRQQMGYIHVPLHIPKAQLPDEIKRLLWPAYLTQSEHVHYQACARRGQWADLDPVSVGWRRNALGDTQRLVRQRIKDWSEEPTLEIKQILALQLDDLILDTSWFGTCLWVAQPESERPTQIYEEDELASTRKIPLPPDRIVWQRIPEPWAVRY